MMLCQDVHHAILGVVGFGWTGQALGRRTGGFSVGVRHRDMTGRHNPLHVMVSRLSAPACRKCPRAGTGFRWPECSDAN
jgi:hypothetical protein